MSGAIGSEWDAFPPTQTAAPSPTPPMADEWSAFPAVAPVPERSLIERGIRGVGMVVQGINEGIPRGLVAIPELAMMGARAIGLPAPAPGAMAGALNRVNTFGVNPDLAHAAPETTLERQGQAIGGGIGEAAGGMAVPLVAGGVIPGAVGRFATSMAANPVLQGVAGGVGGSVTEATGSSLAGAAAAMAVPGVGLLGQAARGMFIPEISPTRNVLLAEAERLGIPITPAGATGGRMLQATESALKELPFTAAPAQRLGEHQLSKYTEEVLREGGITSSSVGHAVADGPLLATPDVVRKGFENAGRMFDELTSGSRISEEASKGLISRLAEIGADAGQNAQLDTARLVGNRIKETIGKIAMGEPGLEGSAFRQLDSGIGQQMRNAANGDARHYLGQVQEALRDAMRASIPAETQAAWDQARREYRALLAIEKAVEKNSPQAIEGYITPAALGQAIGGSATHPLSTLSQMGNLMIKDVIPNSGTPLRGTMNRLLTGSALLGGGAIGAGMGPGVATGAAMLATPRIVQGLYNGPFTRSIIEQPSVLNRLSPGYRAAVAVPAVSHILNPQQNELTPNLDRYRQRPTP